MVALRKQMFRSDGCPVLLPSLIASILWKYFEICYTRFEGQMEGSKGNMQKSLYFKKHFHLLNVNHKSVNIYYLQYNILLRYILSTIQNYSFIFVKYSYLCSAALTIGQWTHHTDNTPRSAYSAHNMEYFTVVMSLCFQKE